MILRCITVLAGLGILAAAAHVNVEQTGGYGAPHAILTIAIAVGVGVGALAIGVAWADGRRTLAILIGIAMLCGELFGLMSSAERLVAARDGAQAPLRDAAAKRGKAVEHVEHAEAALASLPAVSLRLRAAIEAKARADRAAVERAAERGCRENCRALLQAQVEAAAREVAAAREAEEKVRSDAEADVKTARLALAALKAPRSSTPLPDRLGVPGWSFDLTIAALGAVAVNGFAACLLAFGAHQPRRQQAIQVIEASSPLIQAAPVDAVGHAAKFGIECFEPNAGGHVTLAEIREAYAKWCRANGHAPLSDGVIGGALAELFRRAGLRGSTIGSERAVFGVALRSPLVSNARNHEFPRGGREG